MARVARIVVPEIPRHITQRGNNRQPIFFTDDHRRLYLAFLHRYAGQSETAFRQLEYPRVVRSMLLIALSVSIEQIVPRLHAQCRV